MTKKLLLSCIVFIAPLCQLPSQPRQLTIEEMFRLADENSKSIRLRNLAIDEAQQNIKVAQNGLLPSIKAQAEIRYIGDGVMTDRNFSGGEHASLPHLGNSLVIEASQVIYAGGAISKNIRQSKLQKEQAELEYDRNRQDIRFLLTGYYLDLVQLGNQKLVYEKNIEQTELLVKDMRASYRQGTVLKSDITRYELQLQNLELALTNVEDRINILSHKLSTTIGLPPNTIIRPDTAELSRTIIENHEEEHWMRLMHNAPSVRLPELEVRLSENRQDLLKAEKRPLIKFVAANDLAGPILTEIPPLDNNFTYWYAGVGVSYNIDALFKTGKKLKKNRLTTLKLQEACELTKEETGNDIHEAYINLHEAYIRLNTPKKSVQLAHENFNIIRQRYVNGLSLITDMLDASNTQLDMKLQLANCQIDILYQYYLLKKITGVL